MTEPLAAATGEASLEPRNSVLRGAAAYGARQVVMMVVGAAANVAITRLLLPTDFGRIAVLNLVVNFGKLLAVGGVGVYLVQRARDVGRDELNDVVNLQFWLYVALQIGAIVAALGSLAFATDRLVWIMLASMLVSLLFGVLRSGSMIMLERRLEFGKMAAVEVMEQVTNTIVMVALAALGLHAWSVVLGALPAAVLSWRVAQRYAPYEFVPRRPRLTRELREGLVFCAHMFAPYVMGAARVAALPIVVGGLIGLGGVGYCERATFIGTLPFGILSGIQQKVLFSYTARIQETPTAVRRTLEEAVYTSAVLDKFMYLPLVAFASELIRWVFTARWLPSAPLVEIIAWGAAAFGSFHGVTFPVISGLGEPKYLGVSNAVMLVLTWGLLAPFIRLFGLPGYAYVSLTLWAVGPYLYVILRRQIGPFRVLRPSLVPFAAFAAGVAAARWLAGRWLHDAPVPVRLGAWSAAGYAVYIAVLLIIDTRRFLALLTRLRQLLRTAAEGRQHATAAS